jgi:MYXO-CTERM domain-containing protein
MSRLLMVFTFAAALITSNAMGQEATDSAVDDTGPGATTTADTTRTSDDDGGFDPGWIGLLGLAGLAGLMRRNHDTRDNHRANRPNA